MLQDCILGKSSFVSKLKFLLKSELENIPKEKKNDKPVLVKQKQWIQHLLEADFEEKLSLKVAQES